MKDFTYIVIGAGLTGAVIARHIAENGSRVLVADKRDHIAGNIYDSENETGILVQKYGPHIFHTNSVPVYEYIQKYAKWNDFNLECMVYMNDRYTPSPFNFKTIDDYFTKEEAEKIKANIRLEYGDSKMATIVDMLNSKNTVVKKYADFLFENDYSLYTAKQWGISPKEIDISVLKRVPVLFSYKTGYFTDKYQCMPEKGFTDFINNILNHENIILKLNTDAHDFISIENNKIFINNSETDNIIIYTGAVDELLDFKYGPLPYRSLIFEYETLAIDSFQTAPVVAYPQEKSFTRITEYKKLPIQNVPDKTVIAREFPQTYEPGKTDPYYPIPTEKSLRIYESYKKDLDRISNLYLCGRLGDFKYYNMDQAIERALDICEILDNRLS